MKKTFIMLLLAMSISGCSMITKEELATKLKILHPGKPVYADGVDFFVILDDETAVQYRTTGSSWVLKKVK